MSDQAEFDFTAPPKAENAKQASAAVLARIKKLLKLGTNPAAAQGEAETAMRMAYELAEQFRVDLSTLDLDEETRRVIDERWDVGARYDTLRRGIFGLLRRFFHVTTCLDKPCMVVVGKAADLAIARYVHDFLLRAGRAALKADELSEKRARRRMTAAKRVGFLNGFCYGIAAQLEAAKETLRLGDSHKALVVAEEKEREAHMKEIVGETSPLKPLKQTKNQGAVWRGFVQGQATQIHRPLAGGHREAPLALK